MVAVLRLLILANFNSRSLTGTTFWMAALALISLFQSSLPYGSDFFTPPIVQSASDFNPRSLAGATRQRLQELHCLQISIHALLRERPRLSWLHILKANFNPRSLTGATFLISFLIVTCLISIHAPLRERPVSADDCGFDVEISTTLPCGSDVRSTCMSF